MAKKSAYKIMQVSWGEILISPEKSLKQIRFSDGANDWINTKNMLVNIPDNMIGHVCVFARCSVGGAFVIELGSSLPADTSTEVYFLLGEGDRENKYTSFIQTNNHTDFVLNFDTIKALVDTKADKVELNKKADKTELNKKADKTELGMKADKAELNKKADKTELIAVRQRLDNVAHGLENVEHGLGEVAHGLEKVAHGLGNKADKTELVKKADKTELNKKADKTELNKKADKTELIAFEQELGSVEQRLGNVAHGLDKAKQKLDNVGHGLGNKADKAELEQMGAYFDSNKVDRADFQALKSTVDKIKPPILIEIMKRNGTWSVVKGDITDLNEEDGNISFSIGYKAKLIKCYTRADNDNLEKCLRYGCLHGVDINMFNDLFSVSAEIDLNCIETGNPLTGVVYSRNKITASFYTSDSKKITNFYDNTLFFEIIPEE